MFTLPSVCVFKHNNKLVTLVCSPSIMSRRIEMKWKEIKRFDQKNGKGYFWWFDLIEKQKARGHVNQ